MADTESPTDAAAESGSNENAELKSNDAGQTEDASETRVTTPASFNDTTKAAISLAMNFKAPYAFRSRLQCWGTRLIPIITTVLLFATCGDWSAKVDLTIYYRVALFAHAFYFFLACDCYEILGDSMGILQTRNVNYRMPRDNVLLADKMVIGDLMFSCAAYYLILGLQQEVPVFALYLPIIQCSYNFRNDIVWMIGSMSPEEPKRPAIPFAINDALCIWTFGIVYVVHFILEAAPKY